MMKTGRLILSAILSFIFLGCHSDTENRDVSDTENESWFVTKGWEKENLKMDSSTDIAVFEKYYKMHPQRWDTAMLFLLNKDLLMMKSGRYDLIDDEVYATITDAPGRKADTSYFESHRQYADIQYVIEGKEEIRLTDTLSAEIVTPYEPKGDIVFYKSSRYKSLNAIPTKYFIFFPNDVHEPSLSDNDNVIKKLVIKVKLN